MNNLSALRNDRNYRSSSSQMFFKIGVLKNFAIFTGKHLRWSLFLIKLQALTFFIEHRWWLLADLGLQLIEKRLQYRYFPVNIAKFLGTAFFIPLVAASETMTKYIIATAILHSNQNLVST